MIAKCFQAKAKQLTPQWYVIDAEDVVVGRLAAQIAPILMGKHRPTYTPHIDTGDYVIVTNVDKVVYTGKKWEQKVYTRYSGYPGGQRQEAAWKLRDRKPERILFEAVRRMMPKNKLGQHMLTKLKLYVGPHHPHQAQQPIPLEPKTGRPASSGALFAPEPVAPAPRARKARPETEPEAEEPETPQTTAPESPQAAAALEAATASATTPAPKAPTETPPPSEVPPAPTEPDSEPSAEDSSSTDEKTE